MLTDGDVEDVVEEEEEDSFVLDAELGRWCLYTARTTHHSDQQVTLFWRPYSSVS